MAPSSMDNEAVARFVEQLWAERVDGDRRLVSWSVPAAAAATSPLVYAWLTQAQVNPALGVGVYLAAMAILTIAILAYLAKH